MDNPAAFDDPREHLRQRANSTGCVVIEGEHMGERTHAFINTLVSFHVHDDRNRSSALAVQWQTIFEVVEHAVTMLYHTSSWDDVRTIIPNISY